MTLIISGVPGKLPRFKLLTIHLPLPILQHSDSYKKKTYITILYSFIYEHINVNLDVVHLLHILECEHPNSFIICMSCISF